ncbi:hypothetical protein CPC08DRAFT_652413 [Agrocybe pediades]|nr:hypothetical protein CPC08DRAFT_652413 [Agrocybe pediades]
MASRRLDISSLLCDDTPPAFSPLEALVHAATEERKRLDASIDPPPTNPLDPRAFELERRRRIQNEEEELRQNDLERAHRIQQERELQDERRRFDIYERDRQREHEQRVRDDHFRDQIHLREEQERIHRHSLPHREQEPLDDRHRQHRPLPVVTPAISHLLLPRRSDPVLVNTPNNVNASPVIPSSLPDEPPRPIKKRRFSESPTRPFSDDKERIARERDKMHAGELGYGRTSDSPVPGPSHPPRRPGSGHGHTRKPVAVADLLADKEPPRVPDAHRVVSPLGGRRSPPGSQIGRAKAARKSDDHLLKEPPPPQLPSSEVKKIKEETKPPRPRTSSIPPAHSSPRPPQKADIRSKKAHNPPPPLPPPPPPAKTQTQIPKVQQDDAHEWFLQQYDEEPSPTTSTRPGPPHSPSPSLSPITSTVVAAISSLPKSPPLSHKPLTPKAAAVATLEQELEDLVSEPMPASSSTLTSTIVKKQEKDMDLVDLAVSELVETLENDDDDDVDDHDAKPTPAPMEVDVEDELLSLVDDRPPPPPPPPHSQPIPTAASSSVHPPPLSTSSSATAPARRLPGSAASSSHASASTSSAAQLATTTKPAPPTHRVISEARPISPTIMSTPPVSSISSAAAARQVPTKSTSERGSMPPPSTGTSSKKVSGDQSDSPAPPPTAVTSASSTTKKKKETTAKAAASKAKSSATGTPPVAPSKARAKQSGKGKKGANAESVPSVSAPSPVPLKTGKAAGPGKNVSSASRSRSASVMPASVGPESDTAKAEKREEEEESEDENEDDKLYCVCKTKYDEDRFMIACDKCDEWYHTQCVQMPDLEVDLVDQFICPPCIEKNPDLNLKTTYKQRCLYGLRHPNPDSPEACHKAARGAFSKYCSDECGVKYMQSRIDTWAKKGGKTEKLWESVKNAEKREGVVVCVEPADPKENGSISMEVDGPDSEAKPVKPQQRVVPPSKSKVAQETERLNNLLNNVIKLREEIKRGMEIMAWRERLLQLASERAETVGQCGWDQRLCLDDDEWADMGPSVLESYEDAKADVAKGDGGDTDMEMDNVEEQWWCPGKKVCDRHAGWQTVRLKDVCKEKEKKEEALEKLTTREREIRKNIEDMLDPQGIDKKNAANTTTTTSNKKTKDTTSGGPLKAANTKVVNGHVKSKAASAAGDASKKGKKRKAPAS